MLPFLISDCVSMAKKFQLDPHHIFGLCREVNDNLHFLEDHIIIFPSGKYCVRYNLFHKCSTFIPGKLSKELYFWYDHLYGMILHTSTLIVL